MNSLWLSLLVCIASAHRPARLALVTFVLSIQLLHFKIFDATPDPMVYYGSAALFDAVIISLLSRCRGALASDMLIINAVSICAHAAGWIAYEAGYSPLAYNAIIQVLLCAQLARMIWQGGDDDGGRLAANRYRHLLVRLLDYLRHRANPRKIAQ
jgi:hypothetical protein